MKASRKRRKNCINETKQKIKPNQEYLQIKDTNQTYKHLFFSTTDNIFIRSINL